MYKIILSTLLLSSLSFAEKSYSFLGAQTSYLNYENGSAPSVGLKYGIQRGMWRSSLNLDYATKSNEKLTSFIIQIDKGIMKSLTKKSSFKPHIGFSLGMVQHKKDISETGYGIGLNTGVTYLLNKNIDLDLSYRYFSVSSIQNLKSLNSLTFSLHYFY